METTKQIVERLRRKLALDGKYEEVMGFKRWLETDGNGKLFGEEILGIRDGVLYLIFNDSSRAQEIAFNKTNIIEGINKVFNVDKVKDIRWTNRKF